MDVQSTPTGEAEYSTTRKESDKSSGQLECSNVDITTTKNGGFSVRKSYRSKSDSDRSGPSNYREPDTYAFSTFAELVSFLGEAFGQSSAEAPVDTDRASDAGAM